MFGLPFGSGFGGSTVSEVVQQSFLADLVNRRKSPKTGKDTSAWLLEHHGARVIEPLAMEPNPNTYRYDYYYNSKENALYRRTPTINKLFVWKRMR